MPSSLLRLPPEDGEGAAFCSVSTSETWGASSSETWGVSTIETWGADHCRALEEREPSPSQLPELEAALCGRSSGAGRELQQSERSLLVELGWRLVESLASNPCHTAWATCLGPSFSDLLQQGTLHQLRERLGMHTPQLPATPELHCQGGASTSAGLQHSPRRSYGGDGDGDGGSQSDPKLPATSCDQQSGPHAAGGSVVSAAALGPCGHPVWAPSQQLFMRMFPYHFILDQRCRLLQVGPKLAAILPSMQLGSHVSDSLQLERASSAHANEGPDGTGGGHGGSGSSHLCDGSCNGRHDAGSLTFKSLAALCGCREPVLLRASPAVAAPHACRCAAASASAPSSLTSACSSGGDMSRMQASAPHPATAAAAEHARVSVGSQNLQRQQQQQQQQGGAGAEPPVAVVLAEEVIEVEVHGAPALLFIGAMQGREASAGETCEAEKAKAWQQLALDDRELDVAAACGCGAAQELARLSEVHGALKAQHRALAAQLEALEQQLQGQAAPGNGTGASCYGAASGRSTGSGSGSGFGVSIALGGQRSCPSPLQPAYPSFARSAAADPQQHAPSSPNSGSSSTTSSSSPFAGASSSSGAGAPLVISASMPPPLLQQPSSPLSLVTTRQSRRDWLAARMSGSGRSSLDAANPNERAIRVLDDILEGRQVNKAAIIELRDSMLRSNVQQEESIHLKETLQTAGLDDDVKSALLQLLNNNAAEAYELDDLGSSSDDCRSSCGFDGPGGSQAHGFAFDSSQSERGMSRVASSDTLANAELLEGLTRTHIVRSNNGSPNRPPHSTRTHLARVRRMSIPSANFLDGTSPLSNQEQEQGQGQGHGRQGLSGAAAAVATAAWARASMGGAPTRDWVLGLMRRTDGMMVGGQGPTAAGAARGADKTAAAAGEGGRAEGGRCGVAAACEGEQQQQLCVLKEPVDRLHVLLAKVDEWQYNTLLLDEVTDGHALSVLGFALIKRCAAFRKFKMDETKLARFLLEVERGYTGELYHCAAHAADVLRSVHVLGTRGGVYAQVSCSDVSVLSMYIAAVIHDYGHKSVNNDFLVKTRDELAELYNDRSPMENHHVAAGWKLLRDERFNFLCKLPEKNMECLRKAVIDSVLSTDMKQHFTITSQFHALVSAAAAGRGASESPKLSRRPSESKLRVKGAEGDIGQLGIAAKMAWEADDRMLLRQMALKWADLGHLTSPLDVHLQWVTRLEEEMFRQGDQERVHGIPVSPLMDRQKGQGITKSQTGFFRVVALPMYQTMALAFPTCKPLLAALESNLAHWVKEEACAASGGGASAAGSARED